MRSLITGITGFVGSHLALSGMTIFHYKQSTYYDRKKQFTYKWDDPKLNIWWPIKNPILSQRDASVDSAGFSRV